MDDADRLDEARAQAPDDPAGSDGWPLPHEHVTPGPEELAAFEALARSRRTNLRMDPHRPVPAELVERLCRLAMWAPNHKRTWPWRFTALAGGARAELGEALAEALAAAGQPDAKVDKARGKYLRAPLMLAVAAAGDPVATEVVLRQANEVVIMAAVAARRLGIGTRPVDVVLGGGVLTARHPMLHDAIVAGLGVHVPGATVRVLADPPVTGAALLGLDALGATESGKAAVRQSIWNSRSR
jgi:hypothetical protein